MNAHDWIEEQKFEIDGGIIAFHQTQLELLLEDYAARSYAAGAAAMKERDEQIAKLLRNAQWNVHCGQFHQWKTLELCHNEECVKVLAAIRSLEIT